MANEKPVTNSENASGDKKEEQPKPLVINPSAIRTIDADDVDGEPRPQDRPPAPPQN